jgi:hypothetical protein
MINLSSPNLSERLLRERLVAENQRPSTEDAIDRDFDGALLELVAIVISIEFELHADFVQFKIECAAHEFVSAQEPASKMFVACLDIFDDFLHHDEVSVGVAVIGM